MILSLVRLEQLWSRRSADISKPWNEDTELTHLDQSRERDLLSHPLPPSACPRLGVREIGMAEAADDRMLDHKLGKYPSL